MTFNLILWTLGPVQDFIATARKARDLWFGSWLLSELSKSAAKECLLEGGDLVSPSKKGIGSDKTNFPNRILAVVKQDPEILANKMTEAAKARLVAMATEAYKDKKFDYEMAIGQIDDLVETFWVSVPIDEAYLSNGEIYKTARQKAERLLAARKTLRDFDKAHWASDRPKCSLCGNREEVVYAEIDHSLKVGERLCGIGYFKRLGHKLVEERILPSTGHVAVQHYLSKVPKNDPLFGDFVGKVGTGGFKTGLFVASGWDMRLDGSILYESRLKEEKDDKAVRHLKNLLREWKQCTNRSEPSPYYAIVAADGDKIGELVDGLTGVEAHRKLSEDLSDYATKAEGIVKKHFGTAIYTGGDDVLALFPVETVFEGVKELADVFAKKFPGSSLSAGICISHFTSPLNSALNGAREAEHYAKQEKERNAWAIKQDKRSGSPILIGGKWTEYELMQKFIDLFKTDTELTASRGLPYDIDAINQRLQNSSGIDKLVEAEIKRVCRQKNLISIESLIIDSFQKVGLVETAKRLIVARNMGGGF